MLFSPTPQPRSSQRPQTDPGRKYWACAVVELLAIEFPELSPTQIFDLANMLSRMSHLRTQIPEDAVATWVSDFRDPGRA